jgi:predicted RNA methylase
MTIGNPPFGARGSHAIQFMNHAATFSDVIAFILPRSFKKDTFYNRVNPYFHLTSSFDDHEYFRESDRSAQIKTVFQIWQRESDRRGKIARPRSHADFTMRHAHLSRVSEGALRQLRSQYEFTIPQVGSNFFPRDVHSVKRGSHWFIHPLQPGVREVFQKCDFSFLDDMNTAHKSLSKADIVQAYRSAKGDREC